MRPLILGHGLMGAELARQTGWRYLSRTEHGIDITDPGTIGYYISDRYYYPVINCIGYTATRQPEREPSWSVNYLGAMDLSDLCNKYHTKLVHISTDFIYCNSPHPAKEEDVPVHFDNWYTYSKLLADAYIQATCKDYLIVRTSYKARPFPYEKAFINRIGNFDYVDVTASLIIELIEAGARGTYNVGTETKTMMELALRTRPDVQPCYDHVIPAITAMDLTKMQALLKTLRHNI